MDFFVYIIYSAKLDRYYIGHSQNIMERLERHRGGRSKYTKMANDWELKWSEKFLSRARAMAEEQKIKKKKNRRYIEHLIGKEID